MLTKYSIFHYIKKKTVNVSFYLEYYKCITLVKQILLILFDIIKRKIKLRYNTTNYVLQLQYYLHYNFYLV